MTSIRRQLTRELLGVFLVLLGGALAALYYSARSEVLEQFDDSLRAKVLAISSLVVQENGAISVDQADPVFHDFSREEPRDYFELRRHDGTLIEHSTSLGNAVLRVPDQPFGYSPFWYLDLPNGRHGRAIELDFTLNPPGGAKSAPVLLTLIVASDSEDLDEVLTELLTVGAISGLVLFLAIFWIVPRVLARGLKPLDRLGEQASRIDARSLATRFPVPDFPAELQPIADGLNDLLARIEASFERERRFSADLAHELRTPLAELRSLAECALKWPDTRGDVTDRETLAIAAQMQAMVTSLLALARGEHGQLAGHIEPVNVTTLAVETWRAYEARAHERRLKVVFALNPATAAADTALLQSVLGNLFDNAVDYTPEGGEVRVQIQNGAPGVIVRVTNPAENLEPDDVAKLFDRFWRKEQARSGGRHFGLGLPLAHAFARAMDWTLTAEIDEKRQLEFTLVAPRS